MNTREIKLNNYYDAMRERLVSRYHARFNSVGADAEDVVSTAFAYAAKPLLNREGDFTPSDLEKLICNKVNLLFRDAFAAAKRDHGRRSVRAMAVLDEEQRAGDDYRVALIDRWSMTRYAETRVREGDENRDFLQAKAIDCVLMRHGVSARDRDIFDRCLYCNPDRAALASEFQTSVGNIGRIKCECGKLAVEHVSEIRSCYAALKRRCEMGRANDSYS